MTDTLWPLAIATVTFVALHVVPSTPPVRSRIIAAIGEWWFRGIYAGVSVIMIAWMVSAYNDAPRIDVWLPPIALQHIAVSVMPIAAILVVAGLTSRNPTLIGLDGAASLVRPPAGIFTVSRYPVLAGVALWAIVHLLANGDGASLILFGGMLALVIIGSAGIDAKKRRGTTGTAWERWARSTSAVPFAAAAWGRTRIDWRGIGWWRPALGIAVYALLLAAHERLFGVSPLPL